jgi:hypothetical protein
MDIKINCPNCGQHIAIDSRAIGQQVACPTCSKPFTIAVAPPMVSSSLPPPPITKVPQKAATSRKGRLALWLAVAGAVCVIATAVGIWSYSGSKIRQASPSATALGNADVQPAAKKEQTPTGQSVDHSIVGTWVIDPEYSGSLGAYELIMRKSGDATVPKISLVISTNSIIHRYKKPSAEAFAVNSQQGNEFQVIKDSDGNEYYAIQYSYTLNTSATSHEIDLLFTGARTRQGIYKLENDNLWLSIDLNDEKRPVDFTPGPIKSVIKATRVPENAAAGAIAAGDSGSNSRVIAEDTKKIADGSDANGDSIQWNNGTIWRRVTITELDVRNSGGTKTARLEITNVPPGFRAGWFTNFTTAALRGEPSAPPRSDSISALRLYTDGYTPPSFPDLPAPKRQYEDTYICP